MLSPYEFVVEQGLVFKVIAVLYIKLMYYLSREKLNTKEYVIATPTKYTEVASMGINSGTFRWPLLPHSIMFEDQV